MKKQKNTKQTKLLNQTHGKDVTAPTAQPKLLNSMWAFKEGGFPADTEEEYTKILNNLDKVDMQASCVKVGLMPNDSREIMKERLLRQFRLYQASLRASLVKPKILTISEKSKRFLAQSKNNLI
jgi:hypothetical protein